MVEKTEKRKNPLFLVFCIVLFVLLLLFFAFFVSAKISKDVGNIAIGMSREEVLSLSGGERSGDSIEELVFDGKCPLLPFGPKAGYFVDFSSKGGNVQRIEAVYFGEKAELQFLYNAFKAALNIKYFGEKLQEERVSAGFESYINANNRLISLNFYVFGSESCFLSFEVQDTESYEYQIIRDDKYFGTGVPAYPGKLHEDFYDESGNRLFYHRADSSSLTREEMVSNYKNTLQLNGFNVETEIEENNFFICKKGDVRVSCLENPTNPSEMAISVRWLS